MERSGDKGGQDTRDWEKKGDGKKGWEKDRKPKQRCKNKIKTTRKNVLSAKI